MNKMTFFPLNDGDLLYIARNMRDKDKEEIYATRWSESPNALVDDVLHVAALPGSYSAIVGLERPIAVVGAVQPWPGVFDVWCFGTNEFPRIAFSLTKHIRRVMIPHLIELGAHRAHCRALASHQQARDWLHNLGARPADDRPKKAWGKNREDFIEYSWHLEDFVKAVEAA